MRLHNDTIDQVRQRASIVDLFDKGLKRVGSEFVAQCPWHDDKRPSLTVSPKTNRAYCFVCARGVDAIGWIQDRDGLSFTDAVMALANRYGVEVKAENEEDAAKYEAERAERAQLYAECKLREDQFHERIWDCGVALDYLVERGITYSTVVEWSLGWNGERVMFPLRDPQGRTVGFTGRALGDVKPKYKNSQNSLIYQKAEMVFGLDKARDEIIRSGQVVIVEGQFDVIRCWQEGIHNMVAVSGSALTKGMIETLIRTCHVKEVVLCFDGDLGGLKAADRALRELQEIVLRGELTLKIRTLPDGADPADAAEVMPWMISGAPHWVEWWFDREVGKVDLSDPQQLAAAEAGVKRILQVLPTGVLREFVRRRAKEVLKAVPNVAPAKIRTQKQIDACAWAERRALRLYLHDEGCRPALEGIAYKDERMKEGWEVIKTIEGLGVSGRGLRQVFMGVISRFENSLGDELMSLVRPIPEVLRVIHANPVNELEGAMAVLLSDCCLDQYPDGSR